MRIRWVSYQELGSNLQSDLEKLMLYTDPSQGICIDDMYRYIADICLVYAYTYSKSVCNSNKQEDVNFIFQEIYKRNENFIRNMMDAFSTKKYMTLIEVQQLLSQFKVPQT